jgi:3-dehydroquinate synthase
MIEKPMTLTATYPGGQYPLIIGQGLLKQPKRLQDAVQGPQVLIVSNATVAPLYLDSVQAAFEDIQCDTLILPDGEAFKTLDQLEKIWDALAENHHHRDTTLIALGGGVVGDMTGFAAACYHRGVNFIQIPTTLLAQADASVGGKTAVDHRCGKNLIGAFHQPVAVIIDVDTLVTLPDRDYRAGLVEIIKAALIADRDFFEWLEDNLPQLLKKEPRTIRQTLEKACQIKCNIVAADEKEHGQRALLNLGHTFGHAIEQSLHYQDCLHGEAVALGILMAADLSVLNGRLNEEDLKRIQAILTQIQMPHRLPKKIKCDTLLSAIWSDKKVMNNQLYFITLNAIGQAAITMEADEEKLRQIISSYLV